MDKLRIAVVGCGNVSQGHIRGWQNHPDRAEVVALVDVVWGAAEERRERFGLGDVAIYTDWQEAVARSDVDVINICTPGHLHTELIIAAMEAGKHVMTEKPTGWNLEECRKLRWYAQKYPDLKVGVGYSLRYYPLNIRVRELIQSGAIGRIMYAEGAHNHPHDCTHVFDGIPGAPQLSDRAGNYITGSEMTGATHVFDLMPYLFGPVRDVFAFRERYATIVLMRFWSGAMGKATAGTASDQGLATPHVLCIQGTEGTIFTQRTLKENAWSERSYHGYLVRDRRQEPIEVSGTDTGHGDATRTVNFLNAVQKDTPLIAPLEESVGTSELLHAIWDSANMEIRVPVHYLGKTG